MLLPSTYRTGSASGGDKAGDLTFLAGLGGELVLESGRVGCWTARDIGRLSAPFLPHLAPRCRLSVGNEWLETVIVGCWSCS